MTKRTWQTYFKINQFVRQPEEPAGPPHYLISSTADDMATERFSHASSLVYQVNGEDTGDTLSAYSSSPETVFGAAYLAILPSHRLLHGSSSVRSVLEKAFQPGRGEYLHCTLTPSVFGPFAVVERNFYYHSATSACFVCVVFIDEEKNQCTVLVF